MKTILFQGDSITDCRRDRGEIFANNDMTAGLGYGYPLMVASELALRHPGKYTFKNRGISGNRIVDLYARIKIDLINLAPDYLSILIGVNDVWHECSNKNGVDAAKFEKIYRLMLDEIYEALPDIRILLYTPFVLEGSATVDPENPEKWEFFRKETALRADAVRRIARDYPVSLSITQPLFDEAAKVVPAHQLLTDGVHPAIAGNRILTNEFLQWFDETGKKETVVRRNDGNTSIAGRNINRNVLSGKCTAMPAVDTIELHQHRKFLL